MNAQREMTEGEKRVGVNFNPSGNPEIDQVKAVAAGLIDDCMRNARSGMAGGRAASIAATCIEEGAMWLVKSIAQNAKG